MMVKARPFAGIETLAELLTRLGGIPAKRVRYWPFPGTATEKDLLDLDKGYELVDRTLVQKPLDFYESLVASMLLYFFEKYLERNDLGITVGGEAPFRIRRGIVRKPDASFVSWEKMPNRLLPAGDIAGFVPDLAVEVLSRSNTKAEMLRKREEYFRAGTKLVWEIHPILQTASVYTSPLGIDRVEVDGVLDGGDVLPGFQLSLRELFARVRVKPPRPRRRS